MRSRRLLQESKTPSLCAFCAHRLGQNGGPPQVRRRFLQSSRSVSKPPGEVAAVREADDGGSADSEFPGSWIGISGSSNRSVSTPTWGRTSMSNGGSPPATSFGDWGISGQGLSAIPMRNKDAQIAPQSPRTNDDDLLPHERLARQKMMDNAAHEERRVVSINSGPGPQFTRAGRPEPFSGDEQMIRQRRSLSKQSAMSHNERRERALDGFGPRITRHFVHEPNQKTQSAEDSQWSQLRRRGDNDRREQTQSAETRPNEYRGRREVIQPARYTPLSNRSIFYPPNKSGSPHNPKAIGENPQTNIAKMGDNLKASDNRLTYWTNYGQSDTQQSAPFAESVVKSVLPQNAPEIVSWKPLARESDSSVRSTPSNDSQVVQTVWAQDEMTEAFEPRSDKPKKSRIRRGSDTQYVDDAPKGKGRDKARRRQQFVGEEEDISEDAALRAEEKRLRKLEKAAKKAAAPTPILLPEYISVSNLATALKVKLEQFVQKMEDLGFEETSHDHILNGENAGLIAQEYNYEPIIDRSESEDLKPRPPIKDPSKLPPRPPVVTIMGHVDHGKTTLLDWLRKSSVAANEHGGITQHIGAFSVTMPSGKVITFLDTPGHAAFLSMRQRGANVTDIVILVVAADDSVKPQTIEAINHAKSANVPIIVAINKIDKEQADINKVKLDLARHGVEVEDFGGDTQVVCVSGKTGQGMDELEEAAVTLSEILDMRAERSGLAEGWVLEASIKSRGKVATVLVRRGTMRPGDFIVAGKTWARIRCLRNEAGMEIPKAGPGTPVEIDGWREQPEAGDEVLQAPDEAKAKSVIEYRLSKEERDRMAQDMEAINETRRTEQGKRSRDKAEQVTAAAAKAAHEDHVLPDIPEAKANGPKEIHFIVKGDVSGSVEAVIDSVTVLGTSEVRPHILRSGVGQLSEFDVEHTAAAKGVLINFNTPIDPHIARLARENKVPIIDGNIIYRLVDDVKAELSKYLAPSITYRVLGEADVAQIFSITVKGRQQKAVAGCKVRNGTIGRPARVRVLRGGEKVFDGTISSLKNVKKDVAEMKKGGECGIGFEGFTDFQIGDQVQAYEEIVEKRFL